MRFVVGMETSGAVRDAFIVRGHEALSVDLLPAQNGGPHHQGDVFDFLAGQTGFHAGVFHPECTYHTVSAAWAFSDPDFARYPGVGYHQRVKPGTLTGAARRAARDRAELDVLRLRHLPFLKVIENPRGTLPRVLGPAQDVVQPYQFGADASKATCFWCFDAEGQPVPFRLARDPAARVPGREVEWPKGSGKMVERWANQTDSGQNNVSPSALRWQGRSDTYLGVAAALADAVLRTLGADLL